MKPEDRACEGVFLAFQYPVESRREQHVLFARRSERTPQIPRDRGTGRHRLSATGERKAGLLAWTRRCWPPVNEGFSGGEKKRNEIFQMAVLEPRLAILDETDSGLDIDALKAVANGIEAMRSPERGIVLVTTTSACSITLCRTTCM